MLLNTTIHALIASTQAVAAHVIAGLFVGSVSSAVSAVVPKDKRITRGMRWRYLGTQPACDIQVCCGERSEHRRNSQNELFSGSGNNSSHALSQGAGCVTGTGNRI